MVGEEMQQQMPMNQISVQSQKADYESVLALNNANEDIQDFALQLLGVKRIKNGVNYVYRRDKRPLLTYEATAELVRDLAIQVNKVTMRTHFDDNSILNFNIAYANALNDWQCTAGIQAFVSPNVWTKVINEDWKAFGVKWEIDDPFTDNMLNFIKVKYGLEKESCGQAERLHSMYLSILWFIASGRNKSWEHLMLNLEQQIRTETFAMNPLGQNRQSDNAFSRVKESIGKFIPGGQR